MGPALLRQILLLGIETEELVDARQHWSQGGFVERFDLVKEPVDAQLDREVGFRGLEVNVRRALASCECE